MASNLGRPAVKTACLVLLAAACVGSAMAHNSKLVADGQYRVSVGLVNEPIYTDERNGLDLAIRSAGERETLPGLEAGLRAEIMTADGRERRELPVRARYGHPGRYTFDVVLSEPGRYSVRVWGTIQGASFDETFELSEVKPLSELRFP